MKTYSLIQIIDQSDNTEICCICLSLENKPDEKHAEIIKELSEGMLISKTAPKSDYEDALAFKNAYKFAAFICWHLYETQEITLLPPNTRNIGELYIFKLNCLEGYDVTMDKWDGWNSKPDKDYLP